MEDHGYRASASQRCACLLCRPPNYTAWWQRHLCTDGLPGAILDSVTAGIEPMIFSCNSNSTYPHKGSSEKETRKGRCRKEVLLCFALLKVALDSAVAGFKPASDLQLQVQSRNHDATKPVNIISSVLVLIGVVCCVIERDVRSVAIGQSPASVPSIQPASLRHSSNSELSVRLFSRSSAQRVGPISTNVWCSILWRRSVLRCLWIY